MNFDLKKLESLYNQNQRLIIIFLLGLVLIGFGLFFFKVGLFDDQNKIEVINNVAENQNTAAEIVVEIAGSIEKPGVYKLSANSRIEDLLTVSGGLSAVADRDWVNKNINRASKLTDGQKIYIYSQSEVESAKKGDYINLDQDVLGTNQSNLININKASQKELESLSGIGPVYAQKIIDGRIYSSLEELVTKKIIPQKTFDKIKNEISIY